MDAYIFRASLLCPDCGKAAMRSVPIPPQMDPLNESTWDSDDYPKGPYPNGGGEADAPQHCDHCGKFLENPLTLEGDQYLREVLAPYRSGIDLDSRQTARLIEWNLLHKANSPQMQLFPAIVSDQYFVLAEWASFYNNIWE